jgi:hypothetical protein
MRFSSTAISAVILNPEEDVSASKFPLLDRRGRRERLSLIASGGVVL